MIDRDDSCCLYLTIFLFLFFVLLFLSFFLYVKTTERVSISWVVIVIREFLSLSVDGRRMSWRAGCSQCSIRIRMRKISEPVDM